MNTQRVEMNRNAVTTKAVPKGDVKCDTATVELIRDISSM